MRGQILTKNQEKKKKTRPEQRIQHIKSFRYYTNQDMEFKNNCDYFVQKIITSMWRI